jgi:hypothetical protein
MLAVCLFRDDPRIGTFQVICLKVEPKKSCRWHFEIFTNLYLNINEILRTEINHLTKLTYKKKLGGKGMQGPALVKF